MIILNRTLANYNKRVQDEIIKVMTRPTLEEGLKSAGYESIEDYLDEEFSFTFDGSDSIGKTTKVFKYRDVLNEFIEEKNFASLDEALEYFDTFDKLNFYIGNEAIKIRYYLQNKYLTHMWHHG